MRYLISLILGLAVLNTAAAVEPGNGACRDDVQKFCSGGSGAQSMDCLLDHQQEISDACYEAMKQRVDDQRGMSACKSDVKALCSGIQPGGGRLVQCLKEHQKELSDDCYDLLAKKMKQRR